MAAVGVSMIAGCSAPGPRALDVHVLLDEDELDINTDVSVYDGACSRRRDESCWLEVEVIDAEGWVHFAELPRIPVTLEGSTDSEHGCFGIGHYDGMLEVDLASAPPSVELTLDEYWDTAHDGCSEGP